MEERIVVIGLGYVGLPLAVAFGRQFPGTRGYDRSRVRIAELKQGFDRNRDLSAQELAEASLWLSDGEEVLEDVSCYIVAVPTPRGHQGAIESEDIEAVAKQIGPRLAANALVILESTVQPGLTETLFIPWLEASSGKKAGQDFHVAYSPERINPGDRVHTLSNVSKVIAAQDDATLDRVEALYTRIVTAGCVRAPSIQAAELSKLLENTQRDLNIALMNEVSALCEKLGLQTHDVLNLSKTKWNFLPFEPGLVGGHCISVDPWFLVSSGEAVGLEMRLVKEAREANDRVAKRVSDKALDLLTAQGKAIKGAKVAVCGLTFKENVPDLRNSLVQEVVARLLAHRAEVVLVDPWVTPEDVVHWHAPLLTVEALAEQDLVLIAVRHHAFEGMRAQFEQALGAKGVLMDLKGLWPAPPEHPNLSYWRL